jgi:hypothetical protein
MARKKNTAREVAPRLDETPVEAAPSPETPVEAAPSPETPVEAAPTAKPKRVPVAKPDATAPKADWGQWVADASSAEAVVMRVAVAQRQRGLGVDDIRSALATLSAKMCLAIVAALKDGLGLEISPPEAFIASAWRGRGRPTVNVVDGTEVFAILRSDKRSLTFRAPDAALAAGKTKASIVWRGEGDKWTAEITFA